MLRRASSCTPPQSPRPAKRQKVQHLTSESFKNGVMLAPMVRSGSLPTRLFALKHGATLVWSPEVVDKAILHAERVIDQKPYLIYQVGSADPELAVKAAQTVQQDISGIDLNCGCPKPFSTHAGMGAALLTNPDLLCSILKALRAAMPPEISVSAKIRLLPTQEDTLKLVERIVDTGITNLTVHCRTRNMRPREQALIGRMREIVEFVEKMGKGVSVIENGDCVSREDAIRIRDITGAHSCMIATAAESNPTCFSPTPLSDLIKTFVPSYIRLGRYLGNHFGNTKFCAMTFKGANKDVKKAERQRLTEKLHRAKSYEDLDEFVGSLWNGDEELREIENSIAARVNGVLYPLDPPPPKAMQEKMEKELINSVSNGMDAGRSDALLNAGSLENEPTPSKTPPDRENPEPVSTNAPLLPVNEQLIPIPALVIGEDAPTPSPTPRP
ncbi:FMN-linked oxidoreductase [Fomitiporia mediterranea MF3/22]|uniref:FMN-linked oxidoreductase n=1 Tax=Fomitiporia mediterranea (strain MF3/22) TaxID=694068 RepID=UPI0004407D3E|nr:FMN-linked oxidoreductase [Fomitiporia mediterranea MF3/22]EJC98800.1 FMN-linked oxidoreductase [Fomitiporia mediterranea MF3/22]